jgi:signal transduction histidine kinase
VGKFSLTSLRSRAVGLVLLAVLPLLGLILYSYFDQRDKVIHEVQRDGLVAVRNLAAEQETIFNNTRNLLITLARLPEVQRRDREACNLLFAELKKQSPYITGIIATNSEGQLFASVLATPGLVTFADRHWFQKVKQTRDLVLGETVVGRISGQYGDILAWPILDGEGRFLGALATQFNLNWLPGLLANSDFPPTTAIVLTDFSRKVLWHYPEPEKYLGQMLPEALMKPMASGNEGIAAGRGLHGDQRLFAFARLAPPWQELWIFIGLPRNWAMASVNRTLQRNFIFLGLVTLFALAAAWYGAEFFVVRPVRSLCHLTERLAAGDLMVRVGPDNQRGELGLLAHSFNQMAEALQAREADLKQARDELEQRVQERTADLEKAYESVQRSKETLRFLASQLLTVQESERKRLAAELHDELGHALLTLKLNLSIIEKKMLPKQEDLKGEIRSQLDYINEVIKEVRRLYHDLSPGDLEDLGLTKALGNLINDFGKSVPGIAWQLDLVDLEGLFPLPVQTIIYRIMQEALTNIGKHAHATVVIISSQKTDHKVQFIVQDNGTGFDMDQAIGFQGTGGLGLVAMEERLKMIGGSFEIHSGEQRGTRLSFTIPTLSQGGKP